MMTSKIHLGKMKQVKLISSRSTDWHSQYIGCIFAVKGWRKGAYLVAAQGTITTIPAAFCEEYIGEVKGSEKHENRRKLSTWLNELLKENRNQLINLTIPKWTTNYNKQQRNTLLKKAQSNLTQQLI